MMKTRRSAGKDKKTSQIANSSVSPNAQSAKHPSIPDNALKQLQQSLLRDFEFADPQMKAEWHELVEEALTAYREGLILAHPVDPLHLVLVCTHNELHQVELLPSHTLYCGCAKFTQYWQGLVCAHALSAALHLQIHEQYMTSLHGTLGQIQGEHLAQTAMHDCHVAQEITCVTQPNLNGSLAWHMSKGNASLA